MKILITGGAGFIGSHVVRLFAEKYPGYQIYNLDKLTYAGKLDNLKELEGNPRYKFVKGDICDKALVEKIFTDYDVRGVIHLAAESHVDNSIKGPEVFIDTNININDIIHDLYLDTRNYPCQLERLVHIINLDDNKQYNVYNITMAASGGMT